MGAELYKHITQYFQSHLEEVRKVSRVSNFHARAEMIIVDAVLAPGQAAEELQDEPLLKYYTDEWSRYTQGASFVTRLFAYLNRRKYD